MRMIYTDCILDESDLPGFSPGANVVVVVVAK